LLAVAATAGGLWWKSGTGRGPDDPDQSSARVIRRDFSSSVLATGAVKPQVGAEVRVGARISGKVERLHANIGDRVEKGQVIAELEKADLTAAVDQRLAELAVARARFSAIGALRPREIRKAEADVAQCKATVILTEKELARQEGLLKEDVTTEKDRDRALERMSVAKARLAAAVQALELVKTRQEEDLKQAGADVDRSRAALENARVKLSYATITASIKGVIASVATQEGETVAAGLNAPTFVIIIDLDRLQVDAYVDEVDIGKVRPDQRVLFTVDAFPAREFKGRVAAIYPKAVIQENVVNYDVVVEIEDPYGGLLRPEMTASVTILLKARIDVLAVPAAAVLRERGRNVVYVLEGEKAGPREVKIGWKDGPWIEILAGLDEGQAVVLKTPSGPETEQ